MKHTTLLRRAAPLAAALGSVALAGCVTFNAPTVESFPPGTKLDQRADGTLCSTEPIVKDLADGTTNITFTESCKLLEVSLVNNHNEHPKRCVVQFGDQANEVYLKVGESRVLTVREPNTYVPVYANCRNDWNRPK